jgi:hypothetical protein
MKKDTEVKLYMQERRKGTIQRVAAARAGMSERTARKYEQAGQLPSQLKQPHTWKTRPDPFEKDWPWVVSQLERDSALQGTTLFALLCEQYPGRYRPTQVRTLQRHIASWKAVHGPEREVIFEQHHTPGERAQSDFTHMADLGVTLRGQPFPHLYFHLVLTYSNGEAVSLCFSESFEALAEGIERCLWQLGGVPAQHRTDHLSAAVRHLNSEAREDWTTRYQALMRHYGMQPTWNNAGIAHENGDVEQSHFRFKQALDQALRVRGSRDFADRAAYERFVQDLVRSRNQTRQKRLMLERQQLRPLPASPLAPCREVRVLVSRFSTIQVLSIMRDKSVPVNPVKNDEKRKTPQECRARRCCLPCGPAKSTAGVKAKTSAPPHSAPHLRGLDISWCVTSNPPGGDAERAAADGRHTTAGLAHGRQDGGTRGPSGDSSRKAPCPPT